MPLHLALAAYMALNGIDVAQTVSCLNAARCREANPVMRTFAEQPAALGAVKIGVDSAALVTILKLRKNHPKTAWGLTVLGIAAEGAVTVHNARVLRY